MSERGQQSATDGGSKFNAMAFMIRQMLNRLNTSTLVEVVACTNDGGVEPIGYVDVRPLVNQVDGNNNATPHGTIHNVPYFRLVGGTNAVVMDPAVGDIGMAAFADHDLSSVIANKGVANPGSSRRFSMADALYLGSFIAEAPTQYVQFSATGIKIHSPTKVTLEAPVVEINASASATVNTPIFRVNGQTVLNGAVSQIGGAAASFSAGITAAGDVVANGKSLDNHTHNVNNVQGGGSTLPTTGPN